MEEKKKRVFFALEVVSPWPQNLPAGRMLDENHRHMTIAFLGWSDFSTLKNSLESFPLPPFKVGMAGKFDKCLFLPKRHPRVVAWHVEWIDGAAAIQTFQKALIAWLQFHNFQPDVRDLLPHVTICRAPFDRDGWEKNFTPLPMIINNIHLYESLGQLVYEPLWTYPLVPPFQEVDHTADLAFNIHGESLEQLQRHAFVALAFKFPQILDFSSHLKHPNALDDIVLGLNHVVALADSTIGCPFKAVSYHGDITETEDGILTWEMIVDV